MEKKSSKKRLKIRERRIFSESLKEEIVDQLVSEKISIREVQQLYGVSRASVYSWLYRYSPYHKQGVQMVVEKDSEDFRVSDLQKRISELERTVGQKQMQIDLLDKMIELASKKLKTDIKKNFYTKPSNGSDPT